MVKARSRNKDQLELLGPEEDTSDIENGADDEPTRYACDPADNERAAIVKAHARHKYILLRKYVDICSSVRHKWPARCCYIDLYCGPGRSRVGSGGEFVDGSATVAWKASLEVKRGRDSRFAECFIADVDAQNVRVAKARLQSLGASVIDFVGEAKATVESVLARLPSNGLHLAFLDPYGLRALPFSVIQSLAARSSLDILLHFSIMDLRRNLGKFLSGDRSFPLRTS